MGPGQRPQEGGQRVNLYTGCPKCKTTFRVTTQQLQASVGQVRCGHCGEVFDAFASLTAQEPSSAPAAMEATPPLESSPEPALEHVPEFPPLAAKARGSARDGSAPMSRPDPAASLYEWEFRMPVTPSRTGLWITLSLLMAALLAGQAAFAYRTELAVAFPQSRHWLEKSCAVLGCRISSPALSSYLHIESSDLKAVEGGEPNQLQLMASIRNRAPIGLGHPAFELTLTDGLDHAIGRRVFLPHEYLPAGSGPDIQPGAELAVHLFLETGALRAAGYRLYLFYP
jgi:predicted Zn finger-like uncharacterized protein